MLNLDDLATVLHAMLTGFPERALNVVAVGRLKFAVFLMGG